jgi:type II secretory pathway pseudopilin PulG
LINLLPQTLSKKNYFIKPNFQKQSLGFTLTELLVYLAILSLFFAGLGQGYLYLTAKSRSSSQESYVSMEANKIRQIFTIAISEGNLILNNFDAGDSSRFCYSITTSRDNQYLVFTKVQSSSKFNRYKLYLLSKSNIEAKQICGLGSTNDSLAEFEAATDSLCELSPSVRFPILLSGVSSSDQVPAGQDALLQCKFILP